MTLGLGSGSPLFSLSLVLIMLLALYQQIIFGQTIAELRSASAAPLITEVCISGTFSFGFRLSALRITHNPSELHGKRMAERLPARRSADSVSTGSARPSRSWPDGRRDLPPLIVGVAFAVRHSGTLPGRRYAICPRWCHTAFGARYQNRTGTYCFEGSRSAINLIRHTPARRRASRKEEGEKGGYESAQSVVNSTLCVHFTAILIVRSTFKWRNENFFTFSQ